MNLAIELEEENSDIERVWQKIKTDCDAELEIENMRGYINCGKCRQ